jgi:hypothetical protein
MERLLIENLYIFSQPGRGSRGIGDSAPELLAEVATGLTRTAARRIERRPLAATSRPAMIGAIRRPERFRSKTHGDLSKMTLVTVAKIHSRRTDARGLEAFEGA